MQRLKIAKDNKHLATKDDKAVFWLADTAWEMLHKLSFEEIKLYLENRKAKGFNVIQTVLLAELDGLNVANYYGRVPLLKDENGNFDPLKPDLAGDSYWAFVDKVLALASEMEMYIALLPTWGDKINSLGGVGPVIFNQENANEYGKFLAKLYGKYDNIIWVIGGDRPLENFEDFKINRKMALGIKEIDENALMTFHPRGERSSSLNLHNEEWLDFNMIQSGHMRTNLKNYEYIYQDNELEPVKPTLDGEPRYEDHPIGFNPENGYFDDFDIRQAAYWASFSGALGHTYGHHSIWSMTVKPADYFIMDWKTALDRPGAFQMGILKKLMDSKNIINSKANNELLAENYVGANFMQCLEGDDFAFVYSPCGLDFKLNLDKINAKQVKCSWLNPRTGEYSFIANYNCDSTVEFSPVSKGRCNDWVLVLEHDQI